jgi:hypothetical protein
MERRPFDPTHGPHAWGKATAWVFLQSSKAHFPIASKQIRMKQRRPFHRLNKSHRI